MTVSPGGNGRTIPQQHGAADVRPQVRIYSDRRCATRATYPLIAWRITSRGKAPRRDAREPRWPTRATACPPPPHGVIAPADRCRHDARICATDIARRPTGRRAGAPPKNHVNNPALPAEHARRRTMKTWLTVAEGAEYAGISRDTVYTACERRELRHVRIGGRRAIRLKPEWIDAWLERHAQGTPVSSNSTPSSAA